jgi:hypothetical protein
MINYEFRLSLRIWHPSMKPDVISANLELQPEWRHCVGDRRTTPKGNALEGVYKETYWSACLSGEDPVDSVNQSLESVMAEACARLARHAAFICSLRESKGRAEFFVGLYGNDNFGLDLSPGLLASVASLGLSVALDIYP